MILKILKSVGTVILAIAIAFFIKEFIVEFQLIPTGSMIPTLNVGDRIIVNRFAFGIQNPIFTATRKKTIMLVLPNPLYKLDLPYKDVKFIKKFNTPLKRFDVIVFFPPEKPVVGYEYYLDGDTTKDPIYFTAPPLIGERYVKRLIGLPGEVIALKKGVVYINGKKLEEPQKRNLDYFDFGPFRIPEGHYFMMGDNRPRSADSRFWGPVPENLILGRAWWVFWPLNSMKKVE